MISEFSHGLIICLIKFAMHFDNRLARQINSVNYFYNYLKGDHDKLRQCDIDFQKDIELFENIHLHLAHNDVDKALSNLIELWAYGASDHLMEIKIPQSIKGTKLEKKIKELQGMALTIGYGFTKKIWTYDDFQKLKDLTLEIGCKIDLILGILDVDKGKYE